MNSDTLIPVPDNEVVVQNSTHNISVPDMQKLTLSYLEAR